MKILVLGAGGQGAPCASILSKDPEVLEVKLCDIDMELLQKVKDKINHPKIKIKNLDASEEDAIIKESEGMDAIIDLSPPSFFPTVMKAAYLAKVHYVNTAWEEAMFEKYDEQGVKLGDKVKLHDEFVKSDLTAVLGCGMSSGYATNVLARHYVDKLDTVERIKIRLGKKDTVYNDEEEILSPWNPGWNPRTALLDFIVDSYKFENGEFVKIEGAFAEPEMWDFPEPVGRMLVTHHAHEEPFSLPFSFADKGLKYCDFKYYANKQVAPIVALGLGSREKIKVSGVEISPIDVVMALVPKSQNAFLNEDPSKFKELDETKHVSIELEIKGVKNKKEITYRIHVPNMNAPRQQLYDIYGTSLIAVALPAVIGAKMAIEGTKKGVIAPQDMDSNRFIELMSQSGFEHRWQETLI